MTISVDGIYVGFMAGQSGNGLAMFVFLNGIITGSVVEGGTFDGTYENNGSGFDVFVKVTVPPQAALIQGLTTGLAELNYDVEFHLPANFTEQDFHRVETPLGPVNLRLNKLRALENKS